MTLKAWLGTLACVILVSSVAGQNTAPILTSGGSTTIDEEGGTNYFLQAYDYNLDPYVFELDTSRTPPRGNVTLQATGYFEYKACPDFYGEDVVPIIIRKNKPGVNITSQLKRYEKVTVTVRPINDAPVLHVLSPNGTSFDQPTDFVTMEQLTNWTDGTFYKQQKLLVLAWDVDGGDYLAINVTSGPKNGTLDLRACFRDFNFTDTHCALSGSNMTKYINNITTIMERATTVNETGIPEPCDAVSPRPLCDWKHRFSRLACLFTYDADRYYYGNDSVLFHVQDKAGVKSADQTVVFSVQENKCWHESTCAGNTSVTADENCTSAARADGFDPHYVCSCLPGYTGTYCEVDIDECSFNSCPWNQSCIDLPNAFDCQCDRDWPCFYVPLVLTIVVPSVVIGLVLLIVPIVLVFRLRGMIRERKENLRKMKSYEGKDEDQGDSSLARDYTWASNFASLQDNKSEVMSARDIAMVTSPGQDPIIPRDPRRAEGPERYQESTFDLPHRPYTSAPIPIDLRPNWKY